MKILSASIKVPYITSTSIFGEKINNNYYYDGAFIRNVPLLFESDLPQLLIETHATNYCNKLSMKPVDSHIELLALRGVYESKNFFKHDKKNKTIKWIEPNYKKINKNYTFIIIPCLFYLMANFSINTFIS